MASRVTAVILAGGLNSRIETRKPLLNIGGARIIDLQVDALSQVFDDIIVVSGEPGVFEGLGLRVVPDDEEFRGIRCPMTGIYTGLKEAGTDGFVVACDMPFIDPRLMRWLRGLRHGRDLVIPVTGGLAEPLFGIYGRSSLGALRDALGSGCRRVQDVFPSLDTMYVREEELRGLDPCLLSFVNVNTPADHAAAEEVARGERSAACCCGLQRNN